MATSSWTENLDLIGESEEVRRLRAEPFCFEFFQAVRLLERVYSDRKPDGDHKPVRDREPVGNFVLPENEVVRFKAHASLAFPASEVQSLELPHSQEESQPAEMVVNFMGLTGPQGMLPMPYMTLLLETIQHRNYAMRDFFDIFNHRILSLFYLAWKKHRFPVAFESSRRDPISRHLLDLIGLGTPGLENRQEIADQVLLYYAGLLSRHARSATALEQILADYFDVPVEIEQFAGRWYQLDSNMQTCLNESDSVSEQLGIGTVLGDEFWDPKSGARVKLGPLSLSQYFDFLPDGNGYDSLKSLLRFLLGNELDLELQLILKRDEVPQCEPGLEGERAPRLGWCTWITVATMDHDPCETVLPL